jgi:hypothetical protein
VFTGGVIDWLALLFLFVFVFALVCCHVLMLWYSVYSIDFNIMSEGGNYDRWHYSAEYTEFLLYLPFIHNIIDGHFSVKPGGGGVYIIQSAHNTCFYTRFLCCMYADVLHILIICIECLTWMHDRELTSICIFPTLLNRFQWHLASYVYTKFSTRQNIDLVNKLAFHVKYKGQSEFPQWWYCL